MHSHAYRQTGFTLLELLVAVGVFAILGVLAYGGLNSVLATQAHSKLEADRLKALQMSMRYLQRDIEQFVNRPVRDKFGDKRPALIVGDEPILELTHAGWRNPAGLLRSQLQRITYHLNEEDTLVRMTWPLLDGTNVEELLQTPLLNEVEKVDIRVLDEDGEWQKRWPPLNETAANQVETLPPPVALEITLTVHPWGDIRRLIALPR